MTGYKPKALHTYTNADGLPIYWKPRCVHPTFDDLTVEEQKRVSSACGANGHKWIKPFSINDGRINPYTKKPYEGEFMPSEPSGAWQAVYPMGEGKKPLYRLHEITAAPLDQIIWIVEGEQKADALSKLGILATTSGGSTSTTATDWQPLAGRNVRIWRDNDDAGTKYQEAIKTVLTAIGCNVSIVDVDALGLPEKCDVMDWLAMREGQTTTAADVLALPLVEIIQSQTVDGETIQPPMTDGDTIQNALATIEAALILANDSDNPDAGALFEPDVIQALQHVFDDCRPEWARLRFRLKKCKSLKLSDLESIISGKDGSSGEGDFDTCSILINVANDSCQFVHDSDGEPYAILTIGTIRQCYSLTSKAFQEWLSHSYFKSVGTAPSEQSLKAAITAMTGQAKFEGEEKQVYTRVAKYDGSYFIDLCNDEWQVLQITAQGWQVINHPPVLFTRSNTMRPLPMPQAGKGDLSRLWFIANIPEHDCMILMVWLLECFRPDTPYVVLELSGEQGSAKSSTQAALRELIDPNKSNLRTAPKNKDDVFVSAKNSHVVSFENLSHLSSEYQDALCSLATGAGYSGRTLYTNNDETVIELKKTDCLKWYFCRGHGSRFT